MSQDQPGRDAGDVAVRLIEAAFSGDVDAAIALCAPDLVLRMEGTQVVRGHDGLRHVVEFNEDVSTGTRVQIHHVLTSGDTAAVTRTTFMNIGGTPIQLSVGSFFTLRDGLVVEWADYQDMTEVTRALGH